MNRRAPMPTVLVAASVFSDSFMTHDLRLLETFCHPVCYEYGKVAFGSWPTVLGKLLRFLWRVGRFTFTLVYHRPSTIVFWFVNARDVCLMTLIAKFLFRKKLFVITGGYDVVYLPEIDWGQLRDKRSRRLVGWILKTVDTVLPFSDNAEAEIRRTFRTRRMRTVYPAIDTSFFDFDNDISRIDRVVTCCYQYNAMVIIQKGLKYVIDVARRLPSIEFCITGDPLDKDAIAFQQQAPKNVRFLPRLPARSDYRDFLRGSSVYLQLSHHEGFGVSIAEAMACGCVPVVFDRYSMPEVVGDAGYIVPFADVDAAAVSVRAALRCDLSKRSSARSRVVERFSEEHRQLAMKEEFARHLRCLD